MELIEREPQLRKLADAWNQVRAGKGCLALVSGEAGIGKTSLIERFVGGQRKLARVLWGACDGLFSPQPLGPFFDIALQLSPDLLQLLQSGANHLTISTQFFIKLQQSPAPTIVVLEDLHWADEATLDVVKFWGRRIQLTEVLLILSYRDDEIGSQHPLHFLLGDLPPHLVTRIPVPRLSRTAVGRLAQPAGRQPEDLYQATGGNPFFVSEVIASEANGVPSSVREAVLARVTRLSRSARDVVELAALNPGAAEMWLLKQILHADARALDECVERGILHAKGEALAFRHELARQAIEDSLPTGTFRELHTKILAALLNREPDTFPRARLVHHAAGAGDEESMHRYAPAAARQASLLGAHRQAASLYQICLSLTHRLSAESQAEFLEGLSFAHQMIGNVTEAIQAREQALRLWEELERLERVGDCKRWLSRLYWLGGNRKEAEKYADQAVEILRALQPGPELAMAFSNKAQLHMLTEEVEPTLEWGQRAIELAEELNATEIFVHALTNVGAMKLMQGDDQGAEKLEAALRIAREQKMYDHAARCYTDLACPYVKSRHYRKAQQWLEEGIAYATASGLDSYNIYLRGWRARLYFEQGHWDKAQEDALEALAWSRAESVSPIPALITLGHLKGRQGDFEAEDFLNRAQSLSVRTDEFQRVAPLAAARAEAAWWRGDQAQVVAAAVPGYQLALHRNDPWMLGQLAYWLWRAEACEVALDRLARPYALMIQGEWQAAAREWERIGCPFERALALAEGDEPAKREALVIFDQLGAKPAARVLRKKLQAEGVKDIPAEARAVGQGNSAGLTPREVEILQLIAKGLSNHAIAEKLTISLGTVKAHTARVYNKLGVKNRVQALARAQELNLFGK